MNAALDTLVPLTIAIAIQQLYLYMIERRNVRETVADRALQFRRIHQQLGTASNVAQRVQGGSMFVADPLKNTLPQLLVLDQSGITAGDIQITLGQHHLDVGQQAGKKRPFRHHLA